MDEIFDVVVAGGGISGVLTAAKLRQEKGSSYKISVVEKEDALGGRMRTTSIDDSRYSYGLSGISKSLFEYWDQTMKLDPEGADLSEFQQCELKSFGMMGGGKLTSAPVSELDNKLGVRALGGLAAFREWPKFLTELERVVAGEIKERTIGELYKGGRKSPVAIVLVQLGGWFGMPDVFSSSCTAFYNAMKKFKTPLIVGRWEEALEKTLNIQSDPNMEIRTSTHIVNVKRKEDQSWVLMTDKGLIRAKSIVVAQSPWEALKWLPKEFWPGELLSVCLKTKPTSLVSLSSVLNKKVECPDVLAVPSEKCQGIFIGESVTFQTAIDFEMSLSAPNVVKAVKQLKRARKKVLAQFEHVTSEGDFLALVPGGWCVSSALSQKRALAKYSKLNKFNNKELSFCGETFGVSDLGDENILNSIQCVLEAFGASGHQAVEDTEVTDGKPNVEISLDTSIEHEHGEEVPEHFEELGGEASL